MDNTDLAQKLKSDFGLDKRRADMLGILIIGFIKFRTVNLTKLVPILGMKTKRSSRYKRLKRFFKRFRFDDTLLAIFMMLFVGGGPYVLSMDRTNWKYGKLDINILVLGVVYKGIAFPVLWKFLPKTGNSDTKERIDIMSRFIDIAGKKSIGLLLADREFIGAAWVKWLINNDISFILRVRNNTIIEGYGCKRHIRESFKYDKLYQPRSLKHMRKVRGVRLFVSGMRVKDEYLIVISNKQHNNTIEKYGWRREIETFFGCIKTRGFDFEKTHLQDLERINTMLGVIVLAFARAHVTGERLHEQTPIEIKKHKRKQYSIFRYGLDYLRDIFEDITAHLSLFIQVFRLLYRT